MAQSSLNGYAKKIANVNNNKLIIDTEFLGEFCDKIGELPLAVVSINGPMRTGKSYMMTQFMKYLFSLDDDINWFRKTYENEFFWVNSAKRQTTGIHMWSEPIFIIRDNREIAVMLIDTQGTFDAETTTHENTLLFTLSCILSSVLIYNVKNQLTEDMLQFLQLFLSYAKLFNENGLMSRLVFLIRDWHYINEYSYGYHDDSTPEERINYKKQVLNPNISMAPEAFTIHKDIVSMSDNIGCFLLPYPGRGLALHDSIDNLEPEFVENTGNFIYCIFDNSNLITKKFNGKEMNGYDMKDMIEKLGEYFMENEIPIANSVTDATAENQNEMAASVAFNYYSDKMYESLKSPNLSDEEFNSFHEEKMCEAMGMFEKAKRVKNDHIQKKYAKILNENIETALCHYRECKELKTDNESLRRKLNWVDVAKSYITEAIQAGVSAFFAFKSIRA